MSDSWIDAINSPLAEDPDPAPGGQTDPKPGPKEGLPQKGE
jgi:hypothetical protein